MGLILFLCYINDSYSATTLFSVLFADDTNCLSKGKKLNELVTYVNSELYKIALWFKAKKMAGNTLKTKYIIFRTQGKNINNAECNLVFNNNVPGHPEDPTLITPLIKSLMMALKLALSCWVSLLTNIYPLMNIFRMYVLKFPNLFFA